MVAPGRKALAFWLPLGEAWLAQRSMVARVRSLPVKEAAKIFAQLLTNEPAARLTGITSLHRLDVDSIRVSFFAPVTGSARPGCRRAAEKQDGIGDG